MYFALNCLITNPDGFYVKFLLMQDHTSVIDRFVEATTRQF